MTPLDHLVNFEILWSAPGQVLFVILYGCLSRWWETPIGRALLTKSTGLAMILGLVFVNYFFGTDWAARDWVRLIVFTLILVGVYYQLFVFVRTQWRARSELRRGKRAVASDTLARLETASEASRIAAELAVGLAAEDRSEFQKLAAVVDRLRVAADDSALSSARIEAAADQVAVDLTAAHARADDASGPHGAAADASAQSGDDHE